MTRRIRDRATFAALARAQRVRRGPVTLRHVDNGARPTGVAFAVGRGVGGAVARNRVRRRLRAAVHELEAELDPGAYLVGAERAAMTMPFPELVRALGGLVEEVRAR